MNLLKDLKITNQLKVVRQTEYMLIRSTVFEALLMERYLIKLYYFLKRAIRWSF